ncbi:hypothetical protein BS50DRAFT_636804 [Corynespora cassiicola Philippines]|uniref:Uncharacterized protein n=1 Tax=Corynespora cassiicola Philippines TaxID=1448308 RepID=A0A2T2NH01_CORCC|nr:hypothetical protein BS50DRAFT_636804 [Corynespora cassiicola Philippines]
MDLEMQSIIQKICDYASAPYVNVLEDREGGRTDNINILYDLGILYLLREERPKNLKDFCRTYLSNNSQLKFENDSWYGPEYGGYIHRGAISNIVQFKKKHGEKGSGVVNEDELLHLLHWHILRNYRFQEKNEEWSGDMFYFQLVWGDRFDEFVKMVFGFTTQAPYSEENPWKYPEKYYSLSNLDV